MALDGAYTISNADSGRRLFAQDVPEAGSLRKLVGNPDREGLGATAGWIGAEDQLWCFAPEGDGTYAITNVWSGRQLHHRSSTDQLGASRDLDEVSGRRWLLEGVGPFVELVHAESGRRIFAENGKDGEYGFGAAHASAASERCTRWKLERKAEVFSISNVDSGRRLFAQALGQPGLFSREAVEGFGATAGWIGSRDQLWILIPQGHSVQPGHSAEPATYAVVNVASQRRLFADGRHRFGAVRGSEAAAGQAWILEPAADAATKGRVYGLINAESGRRIFAHSGQEGEHGFGATSGGGARDQLWSLTPAGPPCEALLPAGPCACGDAPDEVHMHVTIASASAPPLTCEAA